MRSGKGLAGVGVFGVLLPVLVMVVFAAGAVAQAVTVQYNSQNCRVVIDQVNNAISGDANATQAEAVASVANEINAPVRVVNKCVQGNNNSTGGGTGGGETSPVDMGGVDEEETGLNVEVNEQNCSVVINQYNNAISGSATANGEAAIAAIANRVDAPISVIQKCVQGYNNAVGDEGDKTTNTDNGSVDSAENCVRTGNPIAVLEGNTDDEKAFTVSANEEGTYIVDIEGNIDSAGITTADSDNDAQPITIATDDDDKTEELSQGSYDLSVFSDEQYKVSITKCDPPSNEGNVVNNVKADALSNTGGTVGGVESSPVSSVVVPAGALLAMSSVAGIFWMMRRAESNGER